MSVVHFVLKRTSHFTLPVKSKESLVFHCGVRRFSAAPIFSQHTVGDKQKVGGCDGCVKEGERGREGGAGGREEGGRGREGGRKERGRRREEEQELMRAFGPHELLGVREDRSTFAYLRHWNKTGER